MTNIKAELITRINNDIWVRLLMNGGCNLINGSEPKHDNQVKAVLSCVEGILDLALTQNDNKYSTSPFVAASVNFRNLANNLIIRVDNQNKDKTFHYNVKNNSEIIEDHTPLVYENSEPLKFSLNSVICYFDKKYSYLLSNWKEFNDLPLKILSELLVFKSDNPEIINFPISFLAYPRSQITMQCYSKISQELRLIPSGFVIENNLI